MIRRPVIRCALCLLLVVLTCAPSILHLSHEHSDFHDCMVCLICNHASHIQLLLLEMHVALILFIFAHHLGRAVFLRSMHCPVRLPWPTPILLKVRMNN